MQAKDEQLAEARRALGAAGGVGQVVLELRAQLDLKAREVADQAARCDRLEELGAGTRARCDALVKERRAVQTIMELKVQVLVNEVARAARDVLNQQQQQQQQGGGADPAPADRAAAAATLGKELAALQRLVGASIQALRNAQQEDEMRTRGA